MKRSFINIIRVTVLVLVLVMSVTFFAGCKKSEEKSFEDIKATWLHETTDGRKYYYTFMDNNELEISFGSSVYTGSYKVEEGYVFIGADKGEIYDGNFIGKYGLSFSKDGGTEYLLLADVEGEIAKLSNVSRPQPSDFIKPDSSFVENKALTGTWKISYEGQGDMKLVFNSDGTMVLDIFGIEKNYGVYLVTDTVVIISFYQGQRTDFNENYTITDGKLNILGTTFTK